MKNLHSKLISMFIVAAFLLGGTALKTNAQKICEQIDPNAPANTLTKSEKKLSWKLLFDGKDLKGWHGYNMKGLPDSWVVEDGTVTMTTRGGAESQDIVTDKSYKKFALSLEFKLTKASNSGIIFQVKEDPKYKHSYETGPEFQIMDHENWPDKVEDWQFCGANYAMYPPKVREFKPVGQWNQVMLIVDGNKVKQLLNGKLVVEYEKYSDEWKKLRESGKWADYPDYGKYDEGVIALQNHGTQVFYRNIKIKEL